MPITTPTTNPVMTKDRPAAGPAALMTTPLPTKRPAPMTPPSAIIVMCRCFKPWRSPLEAGGEIFTLAHYLNWVSMLSPARERPCLTQPFHYRGKPQQRSGDGQGEQWQVD